MTTFRQQWNIETALEILQHPTVDSEIWAEAAEWLILYGPPEIQELLQQASGHATQQNFPELKPFGFDKEGNPCYSVSQLAKEMGISEEDALESIAKKEEKHGVQHLIEEDETTTLQ
ncbi:MAG: hypothetical protein GY702_25125 [Desulfobulbaceae bacterium]|nr:hypothetical protein [Desulfobulbaceae bacterium]